MALGRNLKKQSLIPSEEENKQEEKAEFQPKAKKKTSTPAKSKATAKKKVVKKKEPVEPESQPVPVKEQKEEVSQPEIIAPEEIPLVPEESKVQPEQEVAVPTPPAVEEPVVMPVEKRVEPVAAVINVQHQVKHASVLEAPMARISKQEFENRKSLHTRFEQEVQSLKGKVVHVIIFKLGEEEFALDIEKVNEVVLTPSITRMPKAPGYIPGIATIRGRSIVTIDMAQKFGIEDKMNIEDRRRYTIVINTEKYIVGILVPDVPNNQRISGDIIQTASDNISATSIDETYIKGLIRVSGRVIFFLDIDALIEGDRMQSRVVHD